MSGAPWRSVSAVANAIWTSAFFFGCHRPLFLATIWEFFGYLDSKAPTRISAITFAREMKVAHHLIQKCKKTLTRVAHNGNRAQAQTECCPRVGKIGGETRLPREFGCLDVQLCSPFLAICSCPGSLFQTQLRINFCRRGWRAFAGTGGCTLLSRLCQTRRGAHPLTPARPNDAGRALAAENCCAG